MEQLNTEKPGQSRHDNTAIEQSVSFDKKTEIEVLKERLKNFDLEKTRTEEERRRERDQLTEQIDMLRKSLETSEEQQKRLTLLLTDQRPEAGAGEQVKKLQALEATIEELKKRNRRILVEMQQKNQGGFWGRLFGPKPRTKTA